MKKRMIILVTLLLFIKLTVQGQSDKIVYNFPENVKAQFTIEIENNRQYYDTSKYIIALHLKQVRDTVTCYLVRVEKSVEENRRSLLPIVNLSNRVALLNHNYSLPVFFDSDLAFSQWPMGLHGSFFQVKFSLSGKLFKSSYE